MTEAKPTMEPRQLSFFSEWCVVVVWPDGQKQRIEGFTTEVHARRWIENESAAWIASASQSRQQPGLAGFQ